MATYNTLLKKRNVSTNSWDNMLPITTGDNVLMGSYGDNLPIVIDNIHQEIESTKIYVNVKDFGAKGDGVTDDTQAIQNAINSIADGGTLFFPSGTYMSRMLLAKRRVNLKGVGGINYNWETDGNSVIRQIDGSQKCLIDLTSCMSLTIEDIGFKGTNNGVSHGLYFYNTISVNVNRCKVEGFGGSGIFASGIPNETNFSQSLGCRITNCFLTNNVLDGVNLSYYSSDFMISNNYVAGNHRNGATLNGGNGSTIITSNKFEWNVGNGINLYYAPYLIISDNVIDRNFKTGLVIDGSEDLRTHHVTVTGNNFQRNARDEVAQNGWECNHISVGNAYNILIESNSFMYDHDDYMDFNTKLTQSVLSGSLTIRVASTTGIKVGSELFLDMGNIQEKRTVTSISGNVVTLNTALAYGHNVDAYVGSSPITPSFILWTNANSENVVLSNNMVARGYTYKCFEFNGANGCVAENNTGFNPVGYLGVQPPVPTEFQEYQNKFGVKCQVYIFGGEVVGIHINGIETGLTGGVFMLNPEDKIMLQYTVAPTWKWIGM